MSEPTSEPAPESPSKTRSAVWRIYPFEIAAALAVISALVFLRGNGLRMDWLTVTYTIPPMLKPTGRALLVGIPLQIVYLLLRREPLRPYLRRIFTFSWLQLWARLWIAFMAVTYAYLRVKVSVPLTHPTLFDGGLWRLDRILHFGISPSIFAVNLTSGTPLLRFLDVWYGWWLPSIFYGVAFFSATTDDLFRRRMMLSSVLVWSLGSWIYTAVPAMGPCYAVPEVFAATRAETPVAASTQDALLTNYQRVVAGRTGQLNSFNPTRGVAAMPSLHVGLHALLLLWAWNKARPLRALCLVAVPMTFLGSIALGWHYAVDGYVGTALAVFVWWLSGRIEPERKPLAAVVSPGANEAPPAPTPEPASP